MRPQKTDMPLCKVQVLGGVISALLWPGLMPVLGTGVVRPTTADDLAIEPRAGQCRRGAHCALRALPISARLTTSRDLKGKNVMITLPRSDEQNFISVFAKYVGRTSTGFLCQLRDACLSVIHHLVPRPDVKAAFTQTCRRSRFLCRTENRTSAGVGYEP